MKESLIPKYTDATFDEVWNVYTNKTVPNTLVKYIVESKQVERCWIMKNKNISKKAAMKEKETQKRNRQEKKRV